MKHVCKTCGKPVYPEYSKCSNCWEVELRFEEYIRSPKGLEFVRGCISASGDWVDGVPDAWDYETILIKHSVTVVRAEHPEYGWGLSWKHGCMGISASTEVHARKAAALFVELWLWGVSASFADKIMDGYLEYLERQANESN